MSNAAEKVSPIVGQPVSRLAFLIVSMLLMLGAGAASAGAAVVNGGFESGSLEGWQQAGGPGNIGENGEWLVTSGGKAPLSGAEEGPSPEEEISALEAEIAELEEELEGALTPEQEAAREMELAEARGHLEDFKALQALGFGTIPPPAGGSYYAVADETGPSSTILYQDFTVGTELPQTLSLDFFYRSFAPLALPVPDSLELPEAAEGEPQPNQQVRVDVMKAGTSPFSLEAGEILATLYATTTSAKPIETPWTHLTADLSAFAGQAVRLRISAVDNQFLLYAGVDNVSVERTPPVAPPSNAFEFRKLVRNKKRGSAKLIVGVPGPGVLKLVSVRRKAPKKPAKPVRKARRTLAAAGRVELPIEPTMAALRYLEAQGSLRAKIAVTFTPNGGTARTKAKTVVLKKKK